MINSLRSCSFNSPCLAHSLSGKVKSGVTSLVVGALFLMLAGCTTAPKQARKNVPMPPIPKGVTRVGITRLTPPRASVSYVPSDSTLLSLKTFGTGLNDAGKAVAVDQSHNLIVGGSLGGRPFISKRNATGQWVWTAEATGAGGGNVTGVAIDANGDIYVTGNFIWTQNFGGESLTSAGGYDIFLAKYSTNGVHLWSKRFGGANAVYDIPTETSHGIAINPADGSVIITGIFDSIIDFGGGPMTNGYNQDLFIAAFKSDGSHLWSKRVGGNNGTDGRAVAVTKNGIIFLTGYFASPVNFGSGLVTPFGSIDMFLAKFTSTGTNLWVKHFGNSNPYVSTSRGTAIAIDPSGNPIVAGVSSAANISFGGPILTNVGMNDIILAKYSASGAHIWSKLFGGALQDDPGGIAVTASGNIALIGTSLHPGIDFGGGTLSFSSGRRAVVASFDGSGNHRWSKAYGVRLETGNAIAAVEENVFAIGEWSDTVNFDGISATTQGLSDIYTLEFGTAAPPPPPPPAETNSEQILIVDIGNTYLITALQRASNAIAFFKSGIISSGWSFLDSYSYAASDQYVSIELPKNFGTLFCKAVNTPASPPSFAPASVPRLVNSGRKNKINGKTYQLFEVVGSNPRRYINVP